MTFGITLKITLTLKRIICYQFKQRRITWAQNAFVHANSDMSFNVNVTSFDNLSMNI